ncbi:MAG: metal ABC transporter permease [Planctomycetes bacterium]|nr:metal ABC transporter permease [Planctomycetota bacterium]
MGDWLQSLTGGVDSGIHWFTTLWPAGTFLSWHFNVTSMVAIILVALICGMVGSLVVGNRMAFFSDALAHCAFAGVALGLLIALFNRIPVRDFTAWIQLIMVVFGIAIGLGIAWVRDKTSLANDTVIGVFFAGAIGLGALVMKGVRTGFPLESFLFGGPLEASPADLLKLGALLLVTLAVLGWNYNSLVFTSFNASLARSRQVPIRFSNYLFIALLGLIVNLCLSIVGALLINALLIVPAATAANVSRNMRQQFWLSVVLCLAFGIVGHILSWEIQIPDPTSHEPIQFGISGIIVVLSVVAFFISMAVGPMLRRRASAPPLP